MFTLRIHTVDSAAAAPPPPAAAETLDLQTSPASTSTTSTSTSTSSTSASASASASAAHSRDPNPRIFSIRGLIHLYRTPAAAAAASAASFLPSPSSLPAARGTLLFVLAVPNSVSPDDFLRFCGPAADRAAAVRFIRDDGMEDRYSVLLDFGDQKAADTFYMSQNGWRFYSAEGEVCHILFLESVEYTECTEVAGTPPVGATELPTCPVCLERLDQDISGIFATTCDHSFQCSCILKWINSSCMVCQFCRKHSEKRTCSVCGTSENLWICVICGFVGCGRYKEGHAFRHWKETQHCYSLDLESQRVWDYVGDSYVHRLNHSKSDEKLGKAKSDGRLIGGNCKNCEYIDDTDINGATYNSKLERIFDEYSRLVSSELEKGRQYYETKLQEAKDNREKLIGEAVEKGVRLKLQEIQLKIDNTINQKKMVAVANDNLLKDQNLWREKVKELEERERVTLKSKDEKIRELEEEIRDFTVCLEAQKTLENMSGADDIRGGTLLPVEAPPPTKTKRSTKLNRRRN